MSFRYHHPLASAREGTLSHRRSSAMRHTRLTIPLAAALALALLVAGCGDSVPKDAVYESGRSTVVLRMPDEPAERFATLVRAAEIVLKVASEPERSP